MVEVSVVIPSKDNEKSLQRTIESLNNQKGVDLEIIVVDDESHPSYDIQKDNVTVLRNDENSWDPYSRNKGIEHAKGDYILITDDDIVFRQNDWISRAIEKLGKTNSDLIFPKKFDHKNGKVEEVSTFEFRWFDAKPEPIDLEEGEVTYGPMTYLAQKEVFNEIKYDTIYGKKKGYSWMSESDVHLRAKRKGFKLYYYPELEIDHYVGNTEGFSKKKRYWKTHNQVIFNLKNFDSKIIRPILHLVYSVLAANIVYKRPERLLADIKGWKDGIKHYLT